MIGTGPASALDGSEKRNPGRVEVGTADTANETRMRTQRQFRRFMRTAEQPHEPSVHNLTNGPHVHAIISVPR